MFDLRMAAVAGSVFALLGGCAAMAPGMAVLAVDGAVTGRVESLARDAARAQRDLDRNWTVSNEPGRPAVLAGPALRIALAPRVLPGPQRSARFVLSVHLWSEHPGFALAPGSVMLGREAAAGLNAQSWAEPANDAECLAGAGSSSASGAFVPAQGQIVPVRERGHCFELMFGGPPPAIGERYSVRIDGLTKAGVAVAVPAVEFLRLDH
jgi:hypothetical protein